MASRACCPHVAVSHIHGLGRNVQLLLAMQFDTSLLYNSGSTQLLRSAVCFQIALHFDSLGAIVTVQNR
jgi:hypothetical protein